MALFPMKILATFHNNIWCSYRKGTWWQIEIISFKNNKKAVHYYFSVKYQYDISLPVSRYNQSFILPVLISNWWPQIYYFPLLRYISLSHYDHFYITWKVLFSTRLLGYSYMEFFMQQWNDFGVRVTFSCLSITCIVNWNNQVAGRVEWLGIKWTVLRDKCPCDINGRVASACGNQDSTGSKE